MLPGLEATLNTLECRWFGRGATPLELEAWFASCPGQVIAEPQRHDRYLSGITNGGLSLKLRGGGLEIKQRRRDLGLVQLAPSVEGKVEAWLKWRFQLGAGGVEISKVAIDPHWRQVSKQRQLRFYLAGETDGPRSTIIQTTTTPGCEVELASIECDGEVWWTVAFEAFAGDDDESLLLIARYLLDKPVTLPLAQDNSFGYPDWLTLLAPT